MGGRAGRLATGVALGYDTPMANEPKEPGPRYADGSELVRVRATAPTLRLGHQLASLLGMFTLLVILLLVALVGGGLGHSRFGYVGWSPAGIILLVVLVMFLSGTRF